MFEIGWTLAPSRLRCPCMYPFLYHYIEDLAFSTLFVYVCSFTCCMVKI